MNIKIYKNEYKYKLGWLYVYYFLFIFCEKVWIYRSGKYIIYNVCLFEWKNLFIIMIFNIY